MSGRKMSNQPARDNTLCTGIARRLKLYVDGAVW